jgi:NAD(P) transhydrogenase
MNGGRGRRPALTREDAHDMQSDKFDLIVIGSGPAGEKGAAQAAYFGKTVALVEREPVLGGAAANTGTLPSKTLRETALFLSGFRNRNLSGINLSLKHQVNLGDFMAHERYVTECERDRIRANLDRHHVRLCRGTASFVDAHTVTVTPAAGPAIRLQGDVILIAVGSSPFRPAVFPFQDPRIVDSDTILKLRDIPRSMLVVGGGVIGCEYSCMFGTLGVEVAVVEVRDRLIGSLDAEISAALKDQMEAMGIRVRLCDAVVSVRAGEAIDVALKSGGLLKPEMILISSGRNGNTRELALETVGIRVSERGMIPVNEHYQTEVPNIYAAGDVIGSPALASTAMEQARVAMVKAFDLKYKNEVAHILPSGIYTIPECSMAGETEESLTAKSIPYIVGKATYAANARGRIIGDSTGFLKLLFHVDDMRLLGVHVIGEQATELVHVGLTALLLQQGADLFIQTCYNYPTLTELYKYAAYDALGRRAARLKDTDKGASASPSV